MRCSNTQESRYLGKKLEKTLIVSLKKLNIKKHVILYIVEYRDIWSIYKRLAIAAHNNHIVKYRLSLYVYNYYLERKKIENYNKHGVTLSVIIIRLSKCENVIYI